MSVRSLLDGAESAGLKEVSLVQHCLHNALEVPFGTCFFLDCSWVLSQGVLVGTDQNGVRS